MRTPSITALVGATIGVALSVGRLAAGTSGLATEPQAMRPSQIVLDLRDGSKLIGTTDIDFLPLRTSFARLKVPVRLVDSIDFNDDKETVRVHCSSGDELHGTVEIDALKLKTSFGTVQIPLAEIARLSTRMRTGEDGLILHYSFDKVEGGIVKDESGSGHDGRLYDTTLTKTGVRGGACHFNGVDSHVLAGNLGRLDKGTICFWMNADEVTDWRNPFTTDYANGDDCIRFEETDGGRFMVSFSPWLLTTTLVASNWYHVALTWDSTHVCGYLDGVLKLTTNYAGAYPRGLNPDFRNVALGNGYAASPDRFWKGSLDEVRIYNRPFSSAEVASLVRAESVAIRDAKSRIEQAARLREKDEIYDKRKRPARGLDVGLVLYYPFDRDERGKVTDHSPGGHDGETIGATYTIDGRVRGACRFDGNSCIVVGNVLNLGGATSNLTVCVWVKAPPTATAGDGAALIAKEQEARPFTGWGLYADSVRRPVADLIGAYPRQLSATCLESVCDNRWHFLCANYETEPECLRVILYVDGKPRDLADMPGPHPDTATSSPLTIGKRTPGSTPGFVGLLDELRIYDRSLSPQEIESLYRDHPSRISKFDAR